MIIDILHTDGRGVVLHNLFYKLELLVVLKFNGLLHLVWLNGSKWLLLHLKTHVTLVRELIPVGVSQC